MPRTVLFTGFRFAVAFVGLLALSACGDDPAAGGRAAGGPPGGMQLPVETTTVEPQALSTGLNTVGSLRADESVVIRPEVGGRIDEIHFTEGTAVEAGQVLFNLDASLARADLNEALANLENSQRANARAKRLAAQQLIARADYDATRAALAVDQARVASARARVAKMTLRAPFSGQIGLRKVSVGDFVSAGQELVTLVRMDPIEVAFSVPETVMAQLREGQQVTAIVDPNTGKTVSGEITAISPVVDVDSRSVEVRAQIDNPDFKLHPGQFVKLEIDTAKGAGRALLIPEQALMQKGEVRYVFTVVDGKAHKTPIKTGARVPGKIQVVQGLEAGDVVITAGQSKPMMHEGLAVMPVPSPGEKPAAAAPAKPPAAQAPTQKQQVK